MVSRVRRKITAAADRGVKEVNMRRRKPDFLVVLAVLVALGVFFTGMTQAMMRESASAPVIEAKKN